MHHSFRVFHQLQNTQQTQHTEHAGTTANGAEDSCSRYDDNKAIKYIPPTVEIGPQAVSSHLQNCLQREDGSKTPIGIFQVSPEFLALTVVIESQHYCIGNDASNNNKFEGFAFHEAMKQFPSKPTLVVDGSRCRLCDVPNGAAPSFH
jgi:hypothetical protein